MMPFHRQAGGDRLALARAIGLSLLLAWVAWSTGLRISPGWTADDGALLRFASAYPVFEYLFRPELWRVSSHANLTPVMNLFYSYNLALFGLEPTAFRVAMSCVAVVTALLFYKAASLYMRKTLALVALLTFVVSLPFFYTTATLMTNHYLIGMACALAAVIAFRRWLDDESVPALALAVVFYAVAILSKEVYVPLLALLAWQRPIRRVAIGLAPLALVLLGYFGLRYLVLGSLVGGYRSGQFVSFAEWPLVLARLAELPSIALGGNGRAFLALGLTIALVGLSGAGVRIFVFLVLAAVALPLAALAAISPFYEPDRYLFALTAAAAFLFGLAGESVLSTRRLARWAVYGAFLIVAVVIGKQHWERTPELIDRLGDQSVLYAEVLRRDEPIAILNPGLPADDAYWTSMLSLAREAKARHYGTGRHEPVQILGEPEAQVARGAAGEPFVVYRLDKDGCRCLVAATR